MIAQELINQLQKLNPLTEVVFDATENGDEGFRLAPIEKIEEIEDDKGESLILLCPFILRGTSGIDNN